MLYATTRTDRDIYTAQRALTDHTAPDGSCYVPFREVYFTPEQLRELKHQNALQSMAQVLNLLFKTQLTAWDLEFAAGRRPLRLKQLGRRTVAGERWHNTGETFSCLAANLAKRISTQPDSIQGIGSWAEVAAGIASLYALWGLMAQDNMGITGDTVDVAADSETLYSAAGAWLARSWGLPVGRIICGCREDSALWELCHSGQMRTASRQMPEGMELLIYCCGGRREVLRYVEACRTGSVYIPWENTMRRLHQGIFVSVVSPRRVLQTISSVSSAQNYIMSPDTVYAYAAMLDHRAGTGESGWCLILADRSPAQDIPVIAQALGTTAETIKNRLRK